MREQMQGLIDELRKRSIDIYIISDTDDHLSEYSGDHFHALKEFSGFTGGDGKLIAARDGRAFLWTDGRYFIQAEEELKGSGIRLMRMGEPDVPSISQWIDENVTKSGVIGFDGRCVSYKDGEALRKKAGICSADLCGLLWKNRPEKLITPCRILDEKYCGLSAKEKLSRVRAKIKKAGASAHAIASLDDIAWLLNLRADDILYNPVFAAFMLITEDEAFLYTDERRFLSDKPGSTGISEEKIHESNGAECQKKASMPYATKEYLEDADVTLKPYDSFYTDISEAKIYGKSLLADPDRCNYELVSRIPDGIEIIKQINPAAAIKCRKNEAEIKSLRIAQHRDSVALTRFMYWFKKSLGLENCFDYDSQADSFGTQSDEKMSAINASAVGMTEWSCVQKLHELRNEQEGFIEESFSTISAYGKNAAMAHYSPSPLPEKTVEIKPYGLYLVDSGGQYLEGTTDVTRTMSCGAVTDEERIGYTLTVMASLRLADEKFIEGTLGPVIDLAAREVFWKRGLNYNHGTGHGVGFCLNVHEGPVGIRYRAATIEGAYPLYEGMYLSDEPGMYVEGKYGIRTENLLLVKHDRTNEYGRFMCFEIMNFCPIDKSCLDISIMEQRDIKLLNAYHKNVYDKLCNDMNEDELIWLKGMCAPVSKA